MRPKTLVPTEAPALLNLQINGRKLAVGSGATILEAAREHRIDIPTFCADPRLTPEHTCGICVVEIAGKAGLLKACETPVEEGMVIETESPVVAEARREVLNALLKNHNAYCDPPCQTACPAGIDIPGYLDAVAQGDDMGAVRIIRDRLPLARIVGRICPRPCEDVCRRAQIDEPVAICSIKRFAGDAAAGGLREAVEPPTGKRVAVVGGGPSGLSASYYLAKAGHAVTIYEREQELGGTMRNGIPAYRLPRDVIDEEIDEILTLGIKTRTGQKLGRDFSLESLKGDGFDAVYLAMGSQVGKTGPVKGVSGPGSMPAVDFLAEVNAGKWSGRLGKTVVLGGGFTALDAARTAARLGGEVTVVYRRGREEMPASAHEAREAEREGIKFEFLTSPCEVLREDSRVVGVHCELMRLGAPDESGRRRPEPVPGSELTVSADTVLLALGQGGEKEVLGSLKLDSKGEIIIVDGPRQQVIAGGNGSTLPNVFAGGDCSTGPATVVEAIAAGRRAAEAIKAQFAGEPVERVTERLTEKKPQLFDIGAHPQNPAPLAKMPELAPAERINFNEVELGFDEATARTEADRCLRCRCEASTDCKLQAYAVRYEAGTKEYAGPSVRPERLPGPPFLELDRDRCIRCHNCVRICDTVQHSYVYTVDKDDYPALKGSDYRSSGCVFCGQCFSACPTGAIIDRSDRGLARRGERKTVETVCPYCGVGCSLHAAVENGRVVAVKNNIGAPPNDGNLCVKGRYAFSFHDHPERLKYPLVRGSLDQPFREASWEEAVGLVARKLAETKEKHGPDALGMLTSSRGLNEENYVGQKFFRTIIGSNNVDNCARVCHAPSVSGLYRAFGSGAATNPLSDIFETKLLFVTGSNTTEAHPVVGSMVKRAAANGAKLIVADPRGIELTKFADIWLQQKPGTDVALFNSIIHTIIEEGLHDEAFIAERTESFELMRAIVRFYSPEYAEQITGVPAAKVREAARLYAGSGASLILYGLGITEHRTGSNGVTSLANMAMVTGNVGRPGAGINPLRGQNNVQGSCDMGALPDWYPGYRKVDVPENREAYEAAWGCALPEKVGLKEPEMYRAALAGKLKAMYVIGYDPAKTNMNINQIDAAYRALDFCVVQDIFLTQTAKLAHVVLPAACFFEKEGTFTNAERRVRRVRGVIPPPEGLKNDWAIVCDVAAGMGHPEFSFSDAGAIMDDIAACSPIYAGISYGRLEREELVWPVKGTESHGTPLLHSHGFTKGKGTFHDIPYFPSMETPDDTYPFILTTGRVLEHYCNASMTSRSAGINRLRPEELLEINPADAERLGIRDGRFAKVASRRGELTVKAWVTERVKEGVVFLSFHHDATPTNVLTGPGEDMFALTPEYKVCAVRVENA